MCIIACVMVLLQSITQKFSCQKQGSSVDANMSTVSHCELATSCQRRIWFRIAILIPGWIFFSYRCAGYKHVHFIQCACSLCIFKSVCFQSKLKFSCSDTYSLSDAVRKAYHDLAQVTNARVMSTTSSAAQISLIVQFNTFKSLEFLSLDVNTIGFPQMETAL